MQNKQNPEKIKDKKDKPMCDIVKWNHRARCFFWVAMSNGEFMSKRIKTQVEEEEEQGRWFLQYNIGSKSIFGWEVSED